LDVDELRALYARHRVRLLVNEHAAYRFGDRTVQVTGLDDFTGGRPQVNTAESSQPGSVRLLIQHSPGWFRMPEATAINRRFDLCLAGHTHGGQIALFGLPLWTPRGSGDFVAGRYDLAMCPLYVSRGIGTSIAPVRFGARPEIAVFSL
jgi:predicted MPP superfamily phosphohydrolase